MDPRTVQLLRELREQFDSSDIVEEPMEENVKAVLHWVKKKYGAAKAAAHRNFLKMVRKDPAAHRRKMRSDRKYHRTHKWHDKLMQRTSRPGWVRRHVRLGEGFQAYCDFGSGAFSRYCKANPDFDQEDFARFVAHRNRADRDIGELEDIAADEIARLGQEFAEAHGLDERDAGQAFMDVPFELRVTERRQPDPESMKVQTLIFSKEKFTKASAKAWAKKHGFKFGKVDEKTNTYRLRQRDPGEFETFRTISFKTRPGLKAVVAKI
jgi:hypothetical protein